MAVVSNRNTLQWGGAHSFLALTPFLAMKLNRATDKCNDLLQELECTGRTDRYEAPLRVMKKRELMLLESLKVKNIYALLK